MSSEKVKKFKAPKGVPDYLPTRADIPDFYTVRLFMETEMHAAGYEHIELPIFEVTELYARGVGESTDVVSKEMYTFEDRGGRSVTLRPEGTAGVIRAAIEHGLDKGALPVKLTYNGPFFRYERPQAGRYRQLQQSGVEALGVDDPALDAEVIALADRILRGLGLTGFRLEITSLGDSNCRPAYRQALQEYLNGLDLDEATRQRAQINPLRVLDDKRPEVQAQLVDAPLMLDYLDDECRAHFETVTSLLDSMGVSYVINPRMVRGLDYYTKTCFEFVHDGLGAQSGLGGGGRYDGLMAELGGQELSGVGFGIGIDRTILALQAENQKPEPAHHVQVYGIPVLGHNDSDTDIKKTVATLINTLRNAGISADMAYGGKSLKSALKTATKINADCAVVIGEEELQGNVAAVKNLGQGSQETVSLDKVSEYICQLLEA